MDLRHEIESLISSCVQCKMCTKVCPSAGKGGMVPHEIMAIGDGDVSTCIMCGNCNRSCRKTEPMMVMKMLRYLQNNGNFGGHYERCGYIMPISDMEVPQPLWDHNGVSVMSGCVVKGVVPYLEYATSSSLRSMGFTCRPIDNESCCLRPPVFANIPKKEKVERRKDMMKGALDDDLICLCTGCSSEMRVIKGNDVDTIEFLYRNMDRLPKAEKQLKLALKPGCEAAVKIDMLRAVVERLGHIDIGNTFGCCGKDTSVAKELMKDRQAECRDADAILAVCPKCFSKYDTIKGGKPVIFLMELVAMAFGDNKTLGYHRIQVL